MSLKPSPEVWSLLLTSGSSVELQSKTDETRFLGQHGTGMNTGFIDT